MIKDSEPSQRDAWLSVYNKSALGKIFGENSSFLAAADHENEAVFRILRDHFRSKVYEFAKESSSIGDAFECWAARDYLAWYQWSQSSAVISPERRSFVLGKSDWCALRKDIFLSPNEIKCLFDSIPDPRDQALLRLLASTGLRTSDVVAISPANFQKPEHNDPAHLIPASEDTDFNRRICLSSKAYQAADEYCQATGRSLSSDTERPLFRTESRPRMSKRTVLRILNRAADKAGLNRTVTVRKFRWTLGFHVLLQTRNLVSVSEQLGQGTLETTREWYGDFLEQITDTKAASVSVFPPDG